MITLVNPLRGLAAMIFMLPFMEGLQQQLRALFGFEIVWFSDASIEPVMGFAAGLLVWLIRKPREFGRELLEPRHQLFHVGILFLSFLFIVHLGVSVGRNAYEALSFMSLKGIKLYLIDLRFYDVRDDFAPFRFFNLYMLCVFLTAVCLNLLSSPDKILRFAIKPMVASVLCIAFYGFLSAFFGVGYRATVMGVNSFLPDLHAYAGLLLPLVFALALLNIYPRYKFLIGFIVAVGVAGILTSNSKASILICLALGFLFFANNVWQRRINLKAVVVALGLFCFFLLSWHQLGYRSFHKIQRVASSLSAMDENNVNRLLSMRPELYRVAGRLFSEVPFGGIGFGGFLRQSTNFAYHKSRLLRKVAPENVHNYFLQFLTEQGLVRSALLGCLFFLFLFGNLRSKQYVPVVALAGILSGNLYAHSLLITPILFLAAILLGCVGMELGSVRLRALLPVGIVLTGVLLWEGYASINRLPFALHTPCYDKYKMNDQWTSGRLLWTTEEPFNTLTFNPEQPGLAKYPLTVDLTISTVESEQRLFSKSYTQQGIVTEAFAFPRLMHPPYYLELKTSRCYTPINLGVNRDRRRLGLLVQK